MNRIPNPFLGGEVQQQKEPHAAPSPGFLIMTRPPMGANSYGGASSRGRYSPSYRHSPRHSDNFIPFSATGSNNSIQENSRRSGGGRGRYSGGWGQSSPRFLPPYQQSPGRVSERPVGSPGPNQGFPYTPTRPSNSHNWDSFSNSRQNRFSSNSNSRRGRDRGPISDIPIEKFVSATMVMDPWAEFNLQEPTSTVCDSTATAPGTKSVTAILDDSEIIIDSDTSVVLENSYEGRVSGTEGDSSPVPDTGSDSPYVATSSTSEKEVGSDSTGDD